MFRFTQSQTQKQIYKFSTNQRDSLDILSASTTTLFQLVSEFLTTNPLLIVNDTTEHLSFDETIYTTSTSLKEDLYYQLASFSQYINKEVASYIIESLDSNGFFTEDINSLSRILSVNICEIENTLASLYTFLPSGVFASSSVHSLIIQANLNNDYISSDLLSNFSTLLEKKDFIKISQTSNYSYNDVVTSIERMKKLNPFPCCNYSQESEIDFPDIEIFIDKDTIIIKPIEYFNLNVDDTFYDVIMQEPEMKSYYENSKTLIRNISRRNSTLMLVVQEIVSWQKGHFLYDDELVSINQNTIAGSLGINQSTVSRAISNKSYRFNNVIYKLDRLLPSSTLSGDSSDSIREAIKTIISEESKSNPLSDNAISLELNKFGLKASRRTVTKYREQLNYPSSRYRK